MVKSALTKLIEISTGMWWRKSCPSRCVERLLELGEGGGGSLAEYIVAPTSPPPQNRTVAKLAMHYNLGSGLGSILLKKQAHRSECSVDPVFLFFV